MKHNKKVTIILVLMFIITQLLGLFVVNYYLNDNHKIPFGFDQREEIAKTPGFYNQFLASLLISFIIAIVVVFLLMKINSAWIMKLWFFVVITIALGITINALIFKLNLPKASMFALVIGFILAYFKIFRREPITHNLTELLIYPGIAAIFVLMLNLTTTIILLLLISVYDVWAVWKSGIMQKMVKYQMNDVGVFGGFLIPYADKKMKEKIKFLKMKYKNNIPENVLKKSKIKVGIAILGGGDVVFPIIAAGVFLKTFNIYAALSVTFFATLALIGLFMYSKKKKAYPAMPYLTAGILLGMLIGWLLFVL